MPSKNSINFSIVDILEILRKIASCHDVLTLKANVAGFEYSYINDSGEYCTYVYSFENDYVVEKFYLRNELQFYHKYVFSDFMKGFWLCVE